jgi:RNA polymerase sigma factor (sigma-70 family)
MTMDDHTLLAQFAASGKPEVFGELVQRYEALVCAAALRQVANPHLAQDITQATMMVLMRKAGRIRRGMPLGPWLLRVTHYLAVDALRGESTRRRHERLAARERPELMEGSAASPWRSVEPILDQTLHALGNNDRNILVLRYLQEWTIEQIAQELRLTPEATRQRLSRALKRLRKRLAQRGIRNDDLIPALLPPLAAATKSAGVLADQLHVHEKRAARAVWRFIPKALVALGACTIVAGGYVLIRAELHPANPRGVLTASPKPIAAPQSMDPRPMSTIP